MLAVSSTHTAVVLPSCLSAHACVPPVAALTETLGVAAAALAIAVIVDAIRTGSRPLRNSLLAILKNRQDEISPRMGGLIAGLYEDWISLDERIDTIASEIEKISEKVNKKADKFVPRLKSVQTEIVPAQLLNEAGIVGAALAHAQRAGVPHTD